jgi:PAS domain S-box-containing protein
MLPVLLNSNEYFLHSSLFYCVITNGDGIVLHANNLAQQSLKVGLQNVIHADSNYLIQNLLQTISSTQQITLSHQHVKGHHLSINWEIHPVTSGISETYFKWLATAVEMEDQLQKSELFYRNLVADSTIGMLLLNAEGKITFASPSVENILGYHHEELINENGFNFVHPDDLAKALESFQLEIKQTPVVKYIEIRLLKKSGGWLWCMVRGNNLLENPHIKNIVVYFHDDSMRKHAIDALQESEARFRNLIRDLQTGVILQNSNHEVIMCNNAALQILQVSEEELNGHIYCEAIPNVIHEDGTLFRDEERPASKAILTKKPVKDTVVGIYRAKTNDRVWLMANADPILDEQGNVLHVVCSFVDITERKKLEQELVSEQVKHQKMLTQATIDGQEKERKEIGRELHENIGQHLATVKLYLDIAAGNADEKTKEMIRMATKNVSQVINEVRNISTSLVPHMLGDLGLVESIIELVESISRNQALQIQFYDLDFNEDDITENKKLMLFRILQEQLANIVKHANASNVDIVLKNTDDVVELEIIDDGNGFDMNLRNGTGGLATIRSRVELFGGSSHITSSKGQGCSLKVSLPCTSRQVFE